jgi:hypothetical protein
MEMDSGLLKECGRFSSFSCIEVQQVLIKCMGGLTSTKKKAALVLCI